MLYHFPGAPQVAGPPPGQVGPEPPFEEVLEQFREARRALNKAKKGLKRKNRDDDEDSEEEATPPKRYRQDSNRRGRGGWRGSRGGRGYGRGTKIFNFF